MVGCYPPEFKPRCSHLFSEFFLKKLGYTHTCALIDTARFPRTRGWRAPQSLFCLCVQLYYNRTFQVEIFFFLTSESSVQVLSTKLHRPALVGFAQVLTNPSYVTCEAKIGLRACLDVENFCKIYCSTFRCYLVISV